MPHLGDLALWAVAAASLASFADASPGSADEESSGSREYFSVPAFFITFRETIEVGEGVATFSQFRPGISMAIA